jgi:predicted transcriptional regulator
MILESLSVLNYPCSYLFLQGIVKERATSITYQSFCDSLMECVSEGLVLRTLVGKRAVYSITLKGKALLHAFCLELERVVKADIERYGGNGFSQ